MSYLHNEKVDLEYLTPQQVSDILNIGLITIKKWRTQKRGPAFIEMAPRSYWYPIENFNAYMRSINPEHDTRIDQYISVLTAAKRFGLKSTALRKWDKNGYGPKLFWIEKIGRYSERNLTEYMQSKLVECSAGGSS